MAYVAIEVEDQGPRIAYALDAKTGVIVWQVDSIGDWFSVAIANGVVYAVNDGDKNIYALDAMTGAVLGKFGGGNVNSSPVLVNAMVYFTGFDGGVHAYSVGGGPARADKTSVLNGGNQTVTNMVSVFFQLERNGALFEAHAVLRP